MKKGICAYRHKADTHTYPASEPLAVLLQSVWSSVSREAIGLWQCFTHSNTHTGSQGEKDSRERGKKGGRQTGGDSRRSASPQTHSTSTHPLSLGILRLFITILFFPFPPDAHALISCSIILDRVRLKQRSGDTARILPQTASASERRAFVAVSIRI